MKPDLKSWDQADCENHLAALTSSASAMEQALKAAGKDVPQRPTLPAGDILAAVDSMEAHNAKLRVACSVGNVAIPQPAPVAMQASESAPARPLTATEKCRAAKAQAAAQKATQSAQPPKAGTATERCLAARGKTPSR